jgi:hypothetical protein
VFDLPAGTEPTVSTRVKMGQSSNIHALVKADGKFYVATKEVKVTLGGCGGGRARPTPLTDPSDQRKPWQTRCESAPPSTRTA